MHLLAADIGAAGLCVSQLRFALKNWNQLEVMNTSANLLGWLTKAPFDLFRSNGVFLAMLPKVWKGGL